MLRDAYRVGIYPEQFWEYTPKEIHGILEGYFWRRDDRGLMLAAFTSVLANPHYKKKMKPLDLYRPTVMETGRRQPLTLEERKKRFEEAVRIMGPEAIPIK